MSSIESSTTSRKHWRSLAELDNAPEFRAFLEAEFPETADAGGINRRRWLQIMGASFALAGRGRLRSGEAGAAAVRPPPGRARAGQAAALCHRHGSERPCDRAPGDLCRRSARSRSKGTRCIRRVWGRAMRWPRPRSWSCTIPIAVRIRSSEPVRDRSCTPATPSRTSGRSSTQMLRDHFAEREGSPRSRILCPERSQQFADARSAAPAVARADAGSPVVGIRTADRRSGVGRRASGVWQARATRS